MPTSIKINSRHRDESYPRQKYLVVDDEIVRNQSDKEDFILDIGVDPDLALFASNYEQALEMINLHSDIAICFVDSKIPKNERDLYSFEPNANNSSSEWGISLIPEINKAHKNTQIVVYSAYVTKTYLKSRVEQFNNIKGFFGKPGGIKHRKKLYLDAIGGGIAVGKNLNLAKPEEDTFDYSVLDENLSIYLHEKAAGIRKLIRRSAQDIVDIGQSLIEVKNRLEYGQFYNWLKSEFSWSYRTAHRFMRVAQTFESDKLSELDILPSALYELSAPSIPADATEEALQRAEQGETITVDLAKKIKSKHLAKNNPITVNLGQPKDESRPTTGKLLSQERNRLENPSSKPPEILKIIRQPNIWQLGEHLLFHGKPNSSEFIQCLPSKISLNLAFPSQRKWLFSGTLADSEVSFYSRYDHDVDVRLLLEAVERYIKITTDGGDSITICFIPHPDILLLAHRLGCRCFISEPDRSKCEAVVAVWKKFEANNQQAP